VGNPTTRWEDVFRKDTSQIIEMWGWRRWTEDRGEWKRLLREARAQKGCSVINEWMSRVQCTFPIILFRKHELVYRYLM
jgi:hypothetical protein